MSAEHEISTITEYYNLPSPSFRTAVWPLLRAGKLGFEADLPASCMLSDDKIYAPDVPRCQAAREAAAARGLDYRTLNASQLLYVGGCAHGPVVWDRAGC